MNNLFNVLLIFLFTCNDAINQPYEREKEILSYFSEIHNHAINSEIVVLIQTRQCSSCGPSIISLTKQLSERTKVVAILPDSSVSLIEALRKSPLELFIDKNSNLERYGIFHTQDMIYEFKEGKIIYWNSVTDGTLKKIKKYYKCSRF